jgi:epoxyqueuosine reductase
MKTLQESTPEERSQSVKRCAADLGFDACGIASAGPIDPEDRLGKWLACGFHADMHWIEQTKAIRQDVRLKLPSARSVVVVACSYFATRPDAPSGGGRVSRCAWGRDYHRVMRKPMAALAKAISEIEDGVQCYASVDTGPVMEKVWAARAGLGWIGKNGLVIREGPGSWFFLGVIVTTLELAPDAPIRNACGTCDKCMKACPTGAIVEPAVVDARRCISYHTIENRGEIPPELHGRFGNWVFGCDLCQEVCPWNRSVHETAIADFQPRAGCADPDLDDWLALDAPAFNERFAGSPIRRATYKGLRRNLMIAKSNVERL